MSPNPGIIYLGRAGLGGVAKGTTIRINRQGWREDEIPFEKPSGAFRIVGIGDSVMFGWGVEERERYLDVLESRLNRELPGRHWETVTLAMPGYNLMNEIEVLRQVGLRYDPDLILYGYVANDACLPTFVAEPRRVFSTESFIAYYLRRGFSRRPPLVDRSSLRDRNEDVASDRKQRWCLEENVPERYRHLAGEENLKRGIESYRNASLRLGGVSGKDNHPTAEGHAVIADGLFEALLAAELIPAH